MHRWTCLCSSSRRQFRGPSQLQTRWVAVGGPALGGQCAVTHWSAPTSNPCPTAAAAAAAAVAQLVNPHQAARQCACGAVAGEGGDARGGRGRPCGHGSVNALIIYSSYVWTAWRVLVLSTICVRGAVRGCLVCVLKSRVRQTFTDICAWILQRICHYTQRHRNGVQPAVFTLGNRFGVDDCLSKHASCESNQIISCLQASTHQ